MHCTIDDRWIEYRQPIDLWDRPSNKTVGLCWYQNKNGSMRTYDLTIHLIVKLETIIAWVTMSYIVETNLYELHPMDERVFNNFNNDK